MARGQTHKNKQLFACYHISSFIDELYGVMQTFFSSIIQMIPPIRVIELA